MSSPLKSGRAVVIYTYRIKQKLGQGFQGMVRKGKAAAAWFAKTCFQKPKPLCGKSNNSEAAML
jgi:hypothetical protein